MKKLLIGLIFLFAATSFAGEYNCKTEYSKIVESITVIYKVFGGEEVSSKEKDIFKSAQKEINTNVKLKKELDRLNKVFKEMAMRGIILEPKDRISIIAGAYYKSCN